MSLNVNTALYSLYGVDTKNVNQIAEKILKSNQEKQPAVKSIDYSKFNRQTLGIDLYSNRTDVSLQKQIALTQAGLYSKAIDIAKLNSQAAASLYSAASVQKQVELTQSLNGIMELITPKELEKQSQAIQVFNTQDKNSNSSNGFNPFSANEDSKEEKKK